MFLTKVVRVWFIERVTSEHNFIPSEGIRHADIWRKGILGRGNSSGKKALRDMMPSESKQRHVDRGTEGYNRRQARV